MNRILRLGIEGPVTDQSIKEYYELARKYVTLTHPRSGIMDLSAVTSFDVSSETIRQLASLPPVMPDPARPRVVIAPNNLAYGLLRMFQTIGGATRPSLQVVRTHQEAYAYLGVESPGFEPLKEESAGPQD